MKTCFGRWNKVRETKYQEDGLSESNREPDFSSYWRVSIKKKETSKVNILQNCYLFLRESRVALSGKMDLEDRWKQTEMTKGRFWRTVLQTFTYSANGSTWNPFALYFELFFYFIVRIFRHISLYLSSSFMVHFASTFVKTRGDLTQLFLKSNVTGLTVEFWLGV